MLAFVYQCPSDNTYRVEVCPDTKVKSFFSAKVQYTKPSHQGHPHGSCSTANHTEHRYISTSSPSYRNKIFVNNIPPPRCFDNVNNVPPHGSFDNVNIIPPPRSYDNVNIMQRPRSHDNVNNVLPPRSFDNVNDIPPPRSFDNVNDIPPPRSFDNVNNIPIPRSLDNVNNIKPPPNYVNYITLPCSYDKVNYQKGFQAEDRSERQTTKSLNHSSFIQLTSHLSQDKESSGVYPANGKCDGLKTSMTQEQIIIAGCPSKSGTNDPTLVKWDKNSTSFRNRYKAGSTSLNVLPGKKSSPLYCRPDSSSSLVLNKKGSLQTQEKELEFLRESFYRREKELSEVMEQVNHLSFQLNKAKKNRFSLQSSVTASQLYALRRHIKSVTAATERRAELANEKQEVLSKKEEELLQIDKKIIDLKERLEKRKLFNEKMRNKNSISKPLSTQTANATLSRSISLNTASHRRQAGMSRDSKLNVTLSTLGSEEDRKCGPNEIQSHCTMFTTV